jgi:mannose-6-phosphate isomerase-like protein (cupin superfamily)
MFDMPLLPINFQNKLSLVAEHWSPKIIAQMNNYHFKLVKIQGEFVWHQHAETDEVFIIIEGDMEIHFQDGQVNLQAGEMFVVPKGKVHKPYAAQECKLLLIEPAGTVNTGEAGGERTAPSDVWI